MTQSEVLGIVRHVLTTAGGGLVASGYLSASDWQNIVGAIVIMLGVAWSYIQKKQQKAAVVTAAATGIPTPATATSALTSPHA